VGPKLLPICFCFKWIIMWRIIKISIC
jgi:hypothetical protein